MDTDSQRVLVTGGTGFLGGWAIADLLEHGYRVRTTVRSASREQAVRDAVGRVTTADDRLEFAVAELTDPVGWEEAVAGCDYVLHVASPLTAGASAALKKAEGCRGRVTSANAPVVTIRP